MVEASYYYRNLNQMYLRGMPKQKRRRLLFVDDSSSVHGYTRRVGAGHKQRHAYGPEQARDFIRITLSAIERLQAKKAKQREQETNPGKKALLTRQIRFLARLKRRPFDLVVSDINMPSGYPTGMQLLRELRKEFPEMRVMMHSDDVVNLARARRQGAKAVIKAPGFSEADLKAAVIKEFGLDKKRASLKQLEAQAKKYPKRESIVGLKFSNIPTFVVAELFVTAKNSAERKPYKQQLFDLVLAGRLSPNTFKALLRCRWRPDLHGKAIGIYRRDKNGRVIEKSQHRST